jgi:hypothetical protein
MIEVLVLERSMSFHVLKHRDIRCKCLCICTQPAEESPAGRYMLRPAYTDSYGFAIVLEALIVQRS